VLDRLHQTDVAFGDHLRNRQAVAAITHGDLSHVPQVTSDELMRCVAVAVLALTLGKHKFFVRFQHREPPNLFQIFADAGGSPNSIRLARGCAMIVP
jgi:hypothetical protein